MRNNAESLTLKGFKLNFSIEVEEITIHSSDEQNDSLDYMSLMDKVVSATKDVAEYFQNKQKDKHPTEDSDLSNNPEVDSENLADFLKANGTGGTNGSEGAIGNPFNTINTEKQQ